MRTNMFLSTDRIITLTLILYCIIVTYCQAALLFKKSINFDICEHYNVANNTMFHNKNCKIINTHNVYCMDDAFPVVQNTDNIMKLTICKWSQSIFNLSSIKHFQKLKSLNVIALNITQVSGMLPKLKHLQEVRLNNLNLSNISIIESLISAKNLQLLDIRANQLRNISENIFKLLPNLKEVFISENPYICTGETLENYNNWLFNYSDKIKDIEQVNCGSKENSLYPGKPIVQILLFLRSTHKGCPVKCKCEVTNIVKSPSQELIPIITVFCQNLGLTELPPIIPVNTTILHVERNKIFNLQPLAENLNYLKLVDLYLDNNCVTSVTELEGTYWFNHFRILSLRGNQLEQLPTHAFDNTLEKNGNVARLLLGNNPWICDCHFTPSFQNLILKYESVIRDSENITCIYEEDGIISYMSVRQLSRTEICQHQDNFDWDPIDILNVLLASLLFLILGKLSYDYYHYKKSRKLPWIVIKMP